MAIRDIDNENYAQAPRQLIPQFEGDFVRCVAVIDMGTQESVYQGVKKINPEIAYAFEILHQVDGKVVKNNKGEPFIHWITHKRLMSDKANLRKFLKAWRGRDYTEEELKNFKITSAAGQYALGYMVHNPSKDGSKIYENLAVTPVPAAMKSSAPAGSVEPFVFKFASPDIEALKKCPGWLVKKIKGAPEYKEAFEGKDPLSDVEDSDDSFGISDDGSTPPF